MSYEFDAEPQVVRNRPKYKKQETQLTKTGEPVVLQSTDEDVQKRILTPLEQEQLYLKAEKKRLKINQMHAQLLEFKKNRKKMDPYDLKPMGNAKVPVNLDFFLTDCDNQKAKVTEINTQTDAFQLSDVEKERQKYLLELEQKSYYENQNEEVCTFIPKKTGIDVTTQILDWELFDFDKEVLPIAKVIVQKTIIQTALEIEEEQEMKRMNDYKQNYNARRKTEKKKWRKKLNDEIEIMQEKNKLLDLLWQKDQNIMNTSNKLQAYKISQSFFRNMQDNVLVGLYQSGIYPNTFENQLKTIIPTWLYSQVKEYVDRDAAVISQTQAFVEDMHEVLLPMRKEKDEAVQKRKDFLEERRYNQLSKDKRKVWMIFIEPDTPCSKVARYFNKFLEKQLEEYLNTFKFALLKINQEYEAEAIDDEQYEQQVLNDIPIEEAPEFRVGINNIEEFAYTLTHDIFTKTPKDEYRLHPCIALYDDQCRYMETVEMNKVSEELAEVFIFYNDLYDKKLKLPDDMAIKVLLQELPDHIEHMFFCIRVENLNESTNEYKYSKYRLTDFENNFAFESSPFGDDYFVAKQTQPEAGENDDQEENTGPIGGLFVNYYIHKNEKYGWFLEKIHSNVNGTAKEFDRIIQKDIPEYLQEYAFFDYVNFSRLHFEDDFNQSEDAEDQTKAKLLANVKGLRGGQFMSKFQSFAEKSKSKSINGSKIIDQNESIKSKDKSMSKSYNKGSEPEGQFLTQAFGPIMIKVDEKVDQLNERFMDLVTEQADELIESLEEQQGYTFQINKKLLDGEKGKVRHVRRIKNLFGIQMVANEPPPPSVHEEKEGDEDGEENNEDSDEGSGEDED